MHMFSETISTSRSNSNAVYNNEKVIIYIYSLLVFISCLNYFLD